MTDQYEPLVQDIVPLNEVKYAARDYPSIFDSLLRRLKVVYGDVYNDYATSTQGIMLTDLMAYALQSVQWYLDRTASDSFLETARTRAAVARLVKQIGYKMGAAAASSTTLTLTFPDGTSGPFTMPARWQFQGPDGLVFESYAAHVQPVALGAGATISIQVRQGETRLLSYTSNGTKNQQYRLTNITTDRYLGEGTVQVWVDGGLWTENDFLEFTKTNQYEVGYNDDPPTVQFGDGIAGNIPPNTADVKIRFVTVDGVRGNVKADTITSSIDTLLISGEAVDFTVTNSVRANGGSDPETMESAKKLAPFSFAARGAAITQQDYEALSSSFSDPTYGSVALSYAFNPRTEYDDIVFNGYIDQIVSYLTTYVATVSTLETNINTTATSISTPITGLQSDLTNLETLRTDLVTQIGTAITNCDTASGGASTAEAASALAITQCASATTKVNDAYSYVSGLGLLSAGQLSTLQGHTDAALLYISQASGNATTAQTNAGAAETAVQTAVNDFLNQANDSVTNTTPVSPAFTLPSIISDMTADVSSINSSISSLQAQIATIIGTAQTLQTDILAETVLIQDRVGDLFSEDCRSNYVQVPILGLDLEGNYAAPSVGLIAGLQSYLDGIKEVTQYVEVVDGSSILVPAEIDVVLQVNKDAYVEAEVVSDVVATIVGLLKGRSFNSPLYVSTVYEYVMDTSAGIVRANVDIVGPVVTPAVLDVKGNLVPAENQVIVYGSLTITDPNGNTLYEG